MNILYQILLMIGFCSLFACSNTTNSEIELKKEPLAKVQDVLTEEEGAQVVKEGQLSVANLLEEEDSRIRATLFEWEGMIDGKYTIKLEFGCEEDSYQNARETGGVLELGGWYEYETTKEAMRLEGTWNMETKSLVLKRYKEEEVDEIFEGNFVSSFEPIIGTWKKIRTGRALPFELNSTVDKETAILFAQKLGEALLNENAEELSASGTGVDDFGVYLDDLGAWRPSWSMTNNYFEGEASYNSTARGSDYNITIHVEELPTSDEILIWESSSYTSYYKDEEEGEVEEDDDYNYRRSNLWWYDGETFIDILVDTTQKIRVTTIDGRYQVEDQLTQKKWLQSKDNGYLEIIK